MRVVWNSNLMTPDFPIDIRIRLADLKFFLLLPDFANSLPCWLPQQNWASQQGRKLAKLGSNKRMFNSAYLILMSIEKSGTYHQIWIPSNLGFIVSDLTYIPCLHRTTWFWLLLWSAREAKINDSVPGFSAIAWAIAEPAALASQAPVDYTAQVVNISQEKSGLHEENAWNSYLSSLFLQVRTSSCP